MSNRNITTYQNYQHMSKHIKTSDSDTFNLNELLIHIDPTSSTAQGGAEASKIGNL